MCAGFDMQVLKNISNCLVKITQVNEEKLNKNSVTFLSLWRLSRQVIDLQNSVRHITTRLDLIMKKLQLLNEMKEDEALKQLATTKNVGEYEPNPNSNQVRFSFFFGFEKKNQTYFY